MRKNGWRRGAATMLVVVAAVVGCVGASGEDEAPLAGAGGAGPRDDGAVDADRERIGAEPASDPASARRRRGRLTFIQGMGTRCIAAICREMVTMGRALGSVLLLAGLKFAAACFGRGGRRLLGTGVLLVGLTFGLTAPAFALERREVRVSIRPQSIPPDAPVWSYFPGSKIPCQHAHVGPPIL